MGWKAQVDRIQALVSLKCIKWVEDQVQSYVKIGRELDGPYLGHMLWPTPWPVSESVTSTPETLSFQSALTA